jgi:hypothetical protein
MDAIFGGQNYLSEITWKRTTAHSDAKQGRRGFGNINDILLYYSKTDDFKFNPEYVPYDQAYVDAKYPHTDSDGRRYGLWDMSGPGGAAKGNPSYEVMGVTRYWRYSEAKMKELMAQGRIIQPSRGAVPRYKRFLDEMPGVAMQNLWDDISPINSQAQERLGYPTQKPGALLERIIKASSSEGDTVLDPFCGCGTAVHAAQKLKREWIGIDITHLAISLIEKRLNDAFPGIKYEVHGTPKDLEGAQALAAQDKYQFQWWAVSLVNAVPFGGKKKGADSGIDGLIYFKPEGKTTEKAIVSVKGGDNVSVPMIRDLAHVVDREKAKIGVFITLAEPTGPMRTEAVKAGYYETLYGKYPKIQILTIEELFAGKQPNIPLVDSASFRKAAKEVEGGEQDKLPF